MKIITSQGSTLPNGAGLRPSIGKRMPLSIAHRLTAALFGSYAFTWGLVAFGVAGLVALGGAFHEAEKALMLLAFMVFLPLFLWAFAAASLARVWTVLGGGAVFMTAVAWGLQRVLLA